MDEQLKRCAWRWQQTCIRVSASVVDLVINIAARHVCVRVVERCTRHNCGGNVLTSSAKMFSTERRAQQDDLT